MFYYQAFGWTIASELECPELISTDRTDMVDVQIKFGMTPKAIQNATHKENKFLWQQSTATEFLYHFREVATYYATNGDLILIQPQHANVPQKSIRLYLLGVVFSAILYQRGGTMALHASAINTPNGAVLLAGHSQAGKSTTLNLLCRLGYKMISDDVCLLYLENNKVWIRPSFPRSKLWGQSLAVTGHSNQKLSRIRDDLEKFSINLQQQFYNKVAPVKKIIILSPQRDIENMELCSLSGMELMQYLRAVTYGYSFIKGLPNEKVHFEINAAITRTIPVKILRRPIELPTFAEVIDLIQQEINPIPNATVNY